MSFSLPSNMPPPNGPPGGPGDSNRSEQRPPILPSTLNEAVISPKIHMNTVKAAGERRLRKYRKKIEKVVRKFLKKEGEKERYVQFYALGYQLEVVFYEIASDGITYLGEALAQEKGLKLMQWVSDKLNLPIHSFSPKSAEKEPNDVYLSSQGGEKGHLHVLQIIAGAEAKEIKRLAKKVEAAPRSGNPGL